MTPLTRRVVYAVSFETIGIAMSALGPMALSGTGPASAGSISALAAGIALVWNLVFNAGFEAWERRQTRRGRPASRRILHAALFEGGLTLILVPALAFWLDVTIFEAILYEAALIAFFGVYTFVFTWAFDAVFGLPESAR